MTGRHRSTVEIWEEPVRGESLTPAAFTLSGMDRIRGWGRYWPMTPMVHHLGFRLTQMVSGSAVGSLPITPWLQHPDGALDVGWVGETVCGVAADTVLKPHQVIVPLHASYRPLSLVPDDSRVLVARAGVVRGSPDWVYVEGQIEDGDGRAVGSVAMHAAVRPVDFQVPDDPPEFERITPPTYATPDPYRRPVPPEKQAMIDRFHEEGCVATFRAIASGEAPMPPLYSLLGIRPVAADTGRASTELTTSKWLQAVDPVAISPQYIDVQAVSTGVASIWTLAPDGTWPAILEFRGSMIDTAPADGRKITAQATAQPLGRDLVRAQIETHDGDRTLGVSEVTAQFRPKRKQARRRRTRSLMTVLFTDVVDSTRHAERIGDDAWRHTLGRHRELVRSRLEEFGGREIRTTGDGALATFDAPTQAIACACAIRDDARRLGIEIRAGAHVGEVDALGGDIAGIAVHIAARIETAAQPGEVWVSDTMRTLVSGTDVQFEARGNHQLKGVDEPVRIWAAQC